MQYCLYISALTTQRKRRLIANAFRVHHKPQYNRLEPAPIAHTLNMYCFSLRCFSEMVILKAIEQIFSYVMCRTKYGTMQIYDFFATIQPFQLQIA